MTNKQPGDLFQAAGLRARAARVHAESPSVAQALEDVARKFEESAIGPVPEWLREAAQ